MVPKNLIKEVILEQREEMKEIFRIERIIEREGREGATEYLKFPNILAILGPRRAGKSIFSWQLFQNRDFGYINFDDERLLELPPLDLNKVLEVFYEIYGRNLECIVLDEPHNVKGWELFANRLKRTKRVVVTGSNSKLLSGELATHLTGRHISFTLFPFSFTEMLRFSDVNLEGMTTITRAEVSGYLNDFIENGGFPERFKFGKRILREIYSDIVTKDVLRRGKIKKDIEFRKVVNFLISNFSKEFSYRSMKRFVSVKHDSTLSKWVEMLKDVYLIFPIERFSFRLKVPVIAPKKVYCIDTGMINAVGFRVSENMGRLMENLVCIELLRRRNYWYGSQDIFYWKDSQHREVDFVVKEGEGIKELIQVTYADGMDEIDRREIKALLKSSKDLKCKNLLVITWDYEDEQSQEGRKIRFVPLWKWLLLNPVGSGNY
ncbi:MAG: hypothetical protein DRP11_03645 [Candidatus Aenigmatarchaeota archaeon]|nr:MAG: hypothetical protein DRP11_03645 [Candidatus Aenigmarchaeota archaeon]